MPSLWHGAVLSAYRIFMEMSRAFTEWVSAPMDTMSTPVSATARSVSSVMPPLASSRARPATKIHRRLHSGAVHVVQHDDVRPGLQRLPHLVQVAGLHLQLDHMAQLFSDGRHRLGDAAGRVDVIVLEHGAVGQVEAMVFPAAHCHRVFLQGAQAGQGLAGVGDGRVGFPPPAGHTGRVALATPDMCCRRLRAVRSPLSRQRVEPSSSAMMSPVRHPASRPAAGFRTRRWDPAARRPAGQPPVRRPPPPPWP